MPGKVVRFVLSGTQEDGSEYKIPHMGWNQVHHNEHPLWAKELYGYASHRPESEEYGIESLV